MINYGSWGVTWSTMVAVVWHDNLKMLNYDKVQNIFLLPWCVQILHVHVWNKYFMDKMFPVVHNRMHTPNLLHVITKHWSSKWTFLPYLCCQPYKIHPVVIMTNYLYLYLAGSPCLWSQWWYCILCTGEKRDWGSLVQCYYPLYVPIIATVMLKNWGKWETNQF